MAVRSADSAPGSQKEDDRAGLVHSVRSTVDAYRELGAAWLDLVGTETRLMVHGVATVLALAVGIALVAAAGWIFLIGSAIVFAVGLGVPLEGALLVTALLHAGVVVVLALIARVLSARLSFPATRKAIQGRDQEHEGRTQA